MIRPLNNNCLIEVIDEYDGIVGSNKAENVQKGILRDYKLEADHMTASTGYRLYDGTEKHGKQLKAMIGSTVYWQEYADAGSKFDVDGKQFVLVPFYRLIGFED